MRSEVEGAPHYSSNFVHCQCRGHNVTRLFEVDTNFKNVFTLKKIEKLKAKSKSFIYIIFYYFSPSFHNCIAWTT